MAGAEINPFTVFRSLESEDFIYPKHQGLLTGLAHQFFRDVEAAALPVPEGATFSSEITQLWQTLDPAQGHYDCSPIGDLRARWHQTVSVPVPGHSPFVIRFETRLKTERSIRLDDQEVAMEDVSEAVWVTLRKGAHSPRKVYDKRPTILGVPGNQVRRFPARYDYEGDARIDRGFRVALGDLMFRSTDVRLETHTSAGIYPVAPTDLDLHAAGIITLKTARSSGIDRDPITPIGRQLSHLRVLNELAKRAANA